jgi:hypothetical protein
MDDFQKCLGIILGQRNPAQGNALFAQGLWRAANTTSVAATQIGGNINAELLNVEAFVEAYHKTDVETDVRGSEEYC